MKFPRAVFIVTGCALAALAPAIAGLHWLANKTSRLHDRADTAMVLERAYRKALQRTSRKGAHR